MINDSELAEMSLSELDVLSSRVEQAIQDKRNEDRMEVWCVDTSTSAYYTYFRKQDYKKALEFVIEQTNRMLAMCDDTFDGYNISIDVTTISRTEYIRRFPE